MKKSLTIPCLITALGLAAAAPAHADVKVGFVDMDKIFKEYSKTKEAETQINADRESAKKELDEKLEKYKGNIEAINKLNQDIEKPELSKEAKEKKVKERAEKIGEAQSQERELNEFRAQRERGLQDKAQRMRNNIVDEIRSLINDRVKKDQFDLVLDKSGNSLNGVPVILFSKDANDFSDDIIATLNSKAKDSGSAPAKKK